MVLLLAWYVLTPILFPISILAERPGELSLAYLNPMASVIVGYQRALLDGLAPEWVPLLYSAAFALALFLIGFAHFRRARDDFESAL